uniref:protein-tyrosine-phosphatase n=1 Tax=Callorhinchus milii TaxID=7868 RepID=A0A4W3JV82_CALMI
MWSKEICLRFHPAWESNPGPLVTSALTNSCRAPTNCSPTPLSGVVSYHWLCQLSSCVTINWVCSHRSYNFLALNLFSTFQNNCPRKTHQNLVYVAQMAAVLRGEYNDVVSRTYIIDCRYPYEYEGGHIEGSLNLHKADSVINYFLKEPIVPVFRDQRIILIFHCEFSYVRGPKMCRLLREEDRNVNKYPKLHYPELYILKGGYKAFFLQFMRYCNPPEYCPMDHEDYQEEMLKLRKKSKSWAGERRRRDLISRLGMAKCM